MTQEERQLLLQDLCARLPYGIYANLPNHHLVSHKYYIHECNAKSGWTTGILICAGRKECYSAEIEDVQPYLRPMSSMTEEEKEELLAKLPKEWNIEIDKFGDLYFDICEECMSDIELFTDIINWLNKKMFDYRGLIPKGLAISTEEFNPYKD